MHSAIIKRSWRRPLAREFFQRPHHSSSEFLLLMTLTNRRSMALSPNGKCSSNTEAEEAGGIQLHHFCSTCSAYHVGSEPYTTLVGTGHESPCLLAPHPPENNEQDLCIANVGHCLRTPSPNEVEQSQDVMVTSGPAGRPTGVAQGGTRRTHCRAAYYRVR